MIRGAESAVLGASVDEMLKRLLGYALDRLSWMTMREGRFRAEALTPPGLDFTDVFDNIKSRDEYLALLRRSIPFLSDAAFCKAAELIAR